MVRHRREILALCTLPLHFSSPNTIAPLPDFGSNRLPRNPWHLVNICRALSWEDHLFRASGAKQKCRKGSLVRFPCGCIPAYHRTDTDMAPLLQVRKQAKRLGTSNTRDQHRDYRANISLQKVHIAGWLCADSGYSTTIPQVHGQH
jgi:hypothetical protein